MRDVVPPAAVRGASRRDGLDVLRAVAILMVLCFHAPFTMALPVSVQEIFAHGWIGVDLFFVLSGYLIGRQVFEAHSDLPLRAQLHDFWVKRWMRTFPLYFAVLGVYSLKPLFGFPFPDGWRFVFFFQNYVELRDFIQSWSLCVEEHFYVLFPLLAFAAGGRRWPFWVWLVPMVASLASRTWVWHQLPPSLSGSELSAFLQWPTHLHLDGLASGVVLAATAPTWRAWAPPIRLTCGVLGSVVVIITFAVCGPGLSTTDGWSVGLYSGLGVGFALVLIGIESITLPPLLRWPIYSISVLSYGAYLWHALVVRVFERFQILVGVSLLDFLLYLAATFAIAWGSYVTVEKPFLRMRDRWLAR